MQVKLLTGAALPQRAHPTDAGLDLFVYEDTLLTAGKRTLVRTGVSIKIPVGYVGMLLPRSSLSKQGIIMTNSAGVIDSDYRGEILASLMYLCNDEIHAKDYIPHTHLNKGDKIVQLLIVPILLPEISVVSEDGWNDTVRGTGGFGSTGT